VRDGNAAQRTAAGGVERDQQRGRLDPEQLAEVRVTRKVGAGRPDRHAGRSGVERGEHRGGRERGLGTDHPAAQRGRGRTEASLLGPTDVGGEADHEHGEHQREPEAASAHRCLRFLG
jgi:hypothetical protein